MAAVAGRAGRAINVVAGSRIFKPAVFVACAWPLTWLAYRFWLLLTERDPSALGADPNAALLHSTGQTALTILLVTLTVTPVRRLFGANRVQSVRRMLGVWSFAYAAVHLTIYLVFDQLCYSFDTCQVEAIWQDILKRRFILVGQVAFVLLLALAITSTTGWVRRLKKNWARLHRLAYVAAVAGVVHFIWIQKSSVARPLPWMIWLGVVLAIRLYWAITKRFAGTGTAVTT
jgi:sulfoxide reductase heme-binding subunit YedZ